MTVKKAKLPRLHREFTDSLFVSLKGTPLLDANDRAVLDESGRPIYLPPTAGVLKVIKEFLKDNGIDQEPIEGDVVDNLAQKLTHFEGDPLFLEDQTGENAPPEPSQDA